MLNQNSMATPQKNRVSSSNWLLLHHGLVGALLGFPLSLLLSGCTTHYLLGHGEDSAQYQMAMWIVPLFWVTIVSLSFLAPNARACWKWLLVANAAAALVLYPVFG